MTDVLKLSNVSVKFDDRLIIDDVSFTLKEGSIGSLLGPSGCGKTTLLRTIAGFERPVNGAIEIFGREVSSRKHLLPVEKRRVGMVFQDYALFPHLTVRENIAFGINRLGIDEREKRINEIAELLEVSEFVDKYPHRLSGGQQQRVALARAIAPRPKILLLDEPFASMDIELREHIARDVRDVLKKDEITTILVSHNQLEAFAMADEIGVFRDGRLMQWDKAFNLYHRPVCSYVADFVGEGVFLPGRVIDSNSVEIELGVVHGDVNHEYSKGDNVSVLIRPDDIIHDDHSDLQAKVLLKAFRGAEFLYTLVLKSGDEVLSLVPSHHNHAVNELIGIRLEIDHLVIFPENQLEQIQS